MRAAAVSLISVDGRSAGSFMHDVADQQAMPLCNVEMRGINTFQRHGLCASNMMLQVVGLMAKDQHTREVAALEAQSSTSEARLICMSLKTITHKQSCVHTCIIRLLIVALWLQVSSA